MLNKLITTTLLAVMLSASWFWAGYQWGRNGQQDACVSNTRFFVDAGVIEGLTDYGIELLCGQQFNGELYDSDSEPPRPRIDVTNRS